MSPAFTYPVYFNRKQYIIYSLLTLVIVSAIITYYSFKVYTIYHIYSAFVCAVLCVYLSWLYFNPFAEIHEEYFEINKGLFSHKKFYYRDIQRVEYETQKDKLILLFNDFDIAEISLKPIQEKHKNHFIEIIKFHVYKNLSERDE